MTLSQQGIAQAIRVCRRGDAPLACYMFEGAGSKDFARIKAMTLNDPCAPHALLSVNTDAVIAYLAAQRDAGAQARQVFDT